MSTVKIEPFYFGSEEDSIQLQTDELPGALQKQEADTKKEEKPKPTEEENQSQESVVEESEEDVVENEDDNTSEDDNHYDPLNLFPKSDKKVKKEVVAEKEKVKSEDVDYQGITDFLIDTGVFKDFEGKDKFEYTAETFKTLWDAQAKNQVSEQIAEERAQFGGAANQLIDYLKDGGTVETFTENYSQQLDISSIDTKDEDGQERAVKEYYSSIGWKPEKIKKHIERLKDDTELAEEAEDCKSKLVEEIESQRAEMLKEQELVAKDRKIRVDTFNKQVREQIYKDDALADREKKELDKFVFDYKYQDNNGNKYSEFAVKMNEINQDSKKYAKFLKFVKNIEDFEKKSTVENATTKNNFSFLKKGTTLEGAQTAEVVKKKQEGSPQKFVFR